MTLVSDQDIWLIRLTYTASKVSVFGVFLVRIWTECQEILRISPFPGYVKKNFSLNNIASISVAFNDAFKTAGEK